MHSATALPLHYGRAPKWLFSRMVKLAGAISYVIIDDMGSEEFLRRISNPHWFQALSCAIGYDWHSSGTTTVTMGALKEALNEGGEIYVAGGKGKAGNRTPEDIAEGTGRLSISSEAARYTEYSRLSAKVDSALVYDNIGIYHHSFIFSKSRKWAVVQQGMLKGSSTAIRFQWFKDGVNEKDVADEPHTAVQSTVHRTSLDLTYGLNSWARERPGDAIREYKRMFSASYPARHEILYSVDLSKRAQKAIQDANETDPKDYNGLLLTKGVGRATLRSLAFVSSLVYGKELAYRDPVAYAYNLGGKDRIPFEISKTTYDKVVRSMEDIVDSARIESNEKYHILKRLSRIMN